MIGDFNGEGKGDEPIAVVPLMLISEGRRTGPSRLRRFQPSPELDVPPEVEPGEVGASAEPFRNGALAFRLAFDGLRKGCANFALTLTSSSGSDVRQTESRWTRLSYRGFASSTNAG